MNKPITRIKLHDVDTVAYWKGYRTGMVLDVIEVVQMPVNRRGPLYYVNRRGRHNPEGFYRDQFRPKPRHRK
ncbi:hypothetical protein XccvBFoX4_gp60c [Xanthomonas phage FoX4]|uniref:Uncharacterized protein n=1 Tax=Xanthomonas phage FoX4 TaxID=2723900 RepID=A0A858WHR1_9CAUD|nr:hypothetical protein KNU97_gp60 [Xanthomonas phage FoX4]QJI53014.1 hypothetical protein XccvBFoX4_gp60c [Xanthomonas phage FoX4]